MANEYRQDSGNGTGRLDRIEHILELVASNQLAMQEHHDQEFKRLMTWQVLTQGQIEKMAAKVDRLADKVDRLADGQTALDERVDNMVRAIGELIRRMDAGQAGRQ